MSLAQNKTEQQQKHDLRSAVECLYTVAELIASGYNFQNATREEIVQRLHKAHKTLLTALDLGPFQPKR